MSPLGVLRAAGPLGPALFSRAKRSLWDERFDAIGAGDEARAHNYYALSCAHNISII